MKEIELKFLEINITDWRRRLKQLGAKLLIKRQLVTDIFFVPVGERKVKFSTFRLRRIGQNRFLTMKFKVQNKKFAVRDEFEIGVTDFETTKTIVLNAGFKILYQREKYREEFQLGHFKVEIDEYPGVPPYLEVEVHQAKEFAPALKLLGLNIKDAVTISATEVLKKYKQNKTKLIF